MSTPDTSPERLKSIQNAMKDWEGEHVDVIRDLLAMIEERTSSQQFYMDQYARAVKASTDVFQTGGPLAYLLTLGQSTLLDGPKAAADEIARLKAFAAAQEEAAV